MPCRFQTLLIASRNRGKILEYRRLIDAAGLAEDVHDLTTSTIPETVEHGATYEENARLKARDAMRATGLPCLGDDGGIEIAALDGAPGLRTARYTDAAGGPSAAMEQLERALRDRGVLESSPHATLHCAVAIALPTGGEVSAYAVVHGHVRWPRGVQGPGLFPLFDAPGEWDPAAPVLLHRTRAFEAFMQQLDAM